MTTLEIRINEVSFFSATITMVVRSYARIKPKYFKNSAQEIDKNMAHVFERLEFRLMRLLIRQVSC